MDFCLFLSLNKQGRMKMTYDFDKIERMKHWVFLGLWILFLLLFGGCDGGTTTGNPVTVEYDSYDPNAPALKVSRLSNGAQVMSVSGLKMCFKRLRFKPEESIISENIDLEIGELNIDPSGTLLGTVAVDAGVYRRIEFDLEDDCNGYSIEVSNSNGTFQTNDRITIVFEGEFEVINGGANGLVMGIQGIVNALNDVIADDEIKEAAESVSGTY